MGRLGAAELLSVDPRVIVVLQGSLRNAVLARLDADEFSALSDHLEPCDLSHGGVIASPDEAIRFVVFPETGVVSVVVVSPEGQNAEGGVVGREGFVAPFVVLGTDRSPNRIEVQIAGHGHRMETGRFVETVWRHHGLRDVAFLCAQALAIQTSFTAMSNAVHPVAKRLARWILMCHDRCDSDDLALTHRFMAIMLCVRRASVTVALQALEGEGLVRAERGYVTVTARSRLESFAADAYGLAEAEYERLMASR